LVRLPNSQCLGHPLCNDSADVAESEFYSTYHGTDGSDDIAGENIVDNVEEVPEATLAVETGASASDNDDARFEHADTPLKSLGPLDSVFLTGVNKKKGKKIKSLWSVFARIRSSYALPEISNIELTNIERRDFKRRPLLLSFSPLKLSSKVEHSAAVLCSPLSQHSVSSSLSEMKEVARTKQ
jgi:hypothetical protein